jgi:hypothetical protein
MCGAEPGEKENRDRPMHIEHWEARNGSMGH